MDQTLEKTLSPPDLSEKDMDYFLSQIVLSLYLLQLAGITKNIAYDTDVVRKI